MFNACKKFTVLTRCQSIKLSEKSLAMMKSTRCGILFQGPISRTFSLKRTSRTSKRNALQGFYADCYWDLGSNCASAHNLKFSTEKYHLISQENIFFGKLVPKRKSAGESLEIAEFSSCISALPNGFKYYGNENSAKNRLSSSIPALVLLALTFTSRFGESEVEIEEEKLPFVSSFLNKLKSFFVVSAAKPFLNDEYANVIKQGNGGGGSRRKHFNFIADILEAVEDAVVCIEVKDHSTVNWFGMPQASSNGSGFIVKEDGLIITNAHVVASQQRCSITVKLKDGRCFPGFVEDVDYESDLATVRVKARSLPTLKLGCSAETRVGEWVVAVGSPLNLSNTVTAGIVSSTRRGANELGIHANDINYIQTDAAITFGNSGGPLINLDCEAIGINSMKVTAGISFAIPIDHAKKFLERAEERRSSGKARTSRRYMGLSILGLTDQIRRELEMRTGIPIAKQGVFVWQVVRGGPAYLAGIQPGDVIISINGRKIVSASQLHDVVKTADELEIEVQRGHNSFTVTVVPQNVMP